MNDILKAKLKTLPEEPGVYFHRDKNKKIIYIGKASNLKNRVSSYFQESRVRDTKTRLLVADINDTEWMVVGSEVEALFLESEMVKRYKPKYNVDLKDDKNFLYIKVSNDEFPVVTYVRRPMDDKAHYYGPFISPDGLKRAMKYLRKIFPYVTHEHWPARGCLQFHLGLCPGPEEKAITPADYRKTIRKLELYLGGHQTKLMNQLEKEMETASKKKDYELAGRRRDELTDLKAFSRQMIFGDTELFDLTLDQALVGLSTRLELKTIPRRMECYDISHLSGTDNVASMVVFTDGVSNKDEYRRFKMHLDGNDDFAHMREVMERRFSSKNLQEWPKPDLLIIDGGKGQLGAALSVLERLNINVPAIGLAKREEEIIRRRPETTKIDAGHYQDEAWITSNLDWEIILLPKDSHVLHLLQRIRDEAHRFAVTYQSVLRQKRQVKSRLDEIAGIGPVTKKRLLKEFGSVKGVKLASLDELTNIFGPSRAKIIFENLGQN
jgi:excinuclease ABC subunit C